MLQASVTLRSLFFFFRYPAEIIFYKIWVKRYFSHCAKRLSNENISCCVKNEKKIYVVRSKIGRRKCKILITAPHIWTRSAEKCDLRFSEFWERFHFGIIQSSGLYRPKGWSATSNTQCDCHEWMLTGDSFCESINKVPELTRLKKSLQTTV